MAYNHNSFVVYDRKTIQNYLDGRSHSMLQHIEKNPSSVWIMYQKQITHSDLRNVGKRNGTKEGLDKNILYYLTEDEMRKIEENSKKPFESAKQSNIGFPLSFYDDLEIPRLQRRSGPQETQHSHILLNDYCGVYLVNDSLTYFTSYYTKKALSALGKSPRWINDNFSIDLHHGDFTPIQVTQAIHGLGATSDEDFQKLRLSIFKNDTIIMIIEKKKNGERNLYIMLEKNPKFYTLIGKSSVAWERHLITKAKQDEAALVASEEIVQYEKSRSKQAKWKSLLAAEMMNYTTQDGEVFCPFTMIRANFNEIPSLFVGSHIKRYTDSDSKEAWDINNGLLLCANADSLFDKHYISINENKQLVFSFLMEKDYLLKQQLRLSEPLFQMILNEERMKYLESHHEMFLMKEQKRKAGINVDDLDDNFESID